MKKMHCSHINIRGISRARCAASAQRSHHLHRGNRKHAGKPEFESNVDVNHEGGGNTAKQTSNTPKRGNSTARRYRTSLTLSLFRDRQRRRLRVLRLRYFSRLSHLKVLRALKTFPRPAPPRRGHN